MDLTHYTPPVSCQSCHSPLSGHWGHGVTGVTGVTGVSGVSTYQPLVDDWGSRGGRYGPKVGKMGKKLCDNLGILKVRF